MSSLPDVKKKDTDLPEKRAFNIIETELITHHNNLSDSESVENILAHFSQSQDSDVVSKVAVNLHKHNPEKAIMLLETMVESADEKKQLAAVVASGEIASPVTISFLLNKLPVAAKRIKKEIIKTLKKILVVKKTVLSSELEQKIKTSLKKIREKELWVME